MTERFWSHVEKDPAENGCWLWTGYVTPRGYARTREGWAHRVAYELLIGPIPEGLQLDHLCRVTRCVNPSHLEPVTALENRRRADVATGRGKARTHCPQSHPYDEANTYYPPSGGRHCRTCNREQNYARRKAAA